MPLSGEPSLWWVLTLKLPIEPDANQLSRSAVYLGSKGMSRVTCLVRVLSKEITQRLSLLRRRPQVPRAHDVICSARRLCDHLPELRRDGPSSDAAVIVPEWRALPPPGDDGLDRFASALRGVEAVMERMRFAVEEMQYRRECWLAESIGQVHDAMEDFIARGTVSCVGRASEDSGTTQRKCAPTAEEAPPPAPAERAAKFTSTPEASENDDRLLMIT